MFTGLIGEVGSVASLEQDGDGATLAIRSGLASSLRQGDSIAVNGVCLTAVEVSDEGFQAQAMIETLERSSLGRLRTGAPVNLELALRADGRLGGHIVQGHVDGTGRVREVREEGFARVLAIDVEPQLARYLVEKGSVALDGVSLTVSALDEHGFSVSLIPETLEHTNLGELREGEIVNIEVDILAKHVERLLTSPYGGPTDSPDTNGGTA
ncbi:MAG TPA: riboflavin synthase [Solirubrobacteraceae bacterium]|jgi:riboflavin synthase|nr:riboflavin synthase [Solirubrobacteraceae bacterium]